MLLQEPAGICELRAYDEPPAVVEAARRAHRTMRLPDTGPGLPWDVGRPAKALPGIVIEADDAERTGEWIESTYSQPFLGEGYLHDNNTGKGRKSLRFRPGLTAAGSYEIRIAYVAYKNRATNTPITVHAAGGAQTLRINQREKPPLDGLFRSLGEFRLDRQSTVVVSTDQTDGYVVVDALQLLPAARPERP